MEDKSKGEIWFKAKSYGYGWYPATWQGWGILFFYILVMILIFLRARDLSKSGFDLIVNFTVPFLVGTGLLIFICYKKGEKPYWRWGNRK